MGQVKKTFSTLRRILSIRGVLTEIYTLLSWDTKLNILEISLNKYTVKQDMWG